MTNTIPPVSTPPAGGVDQHTQDIVDAFFKNIETTDLKSRITADGKFTSGLGVPGLAQPPAMSSTQLMTLLSSLTRKLQMRAIGTQEGAVKDQQDQQQVNYKDNKKKIEKQRHKTHKAKKSGLALKIFGWIAAALAVVASAIVAVVSFGAGAPLVCACACLSIALTVTMVTLSETGAMDKMTKPLTDGFTKMARAFGANPRLAKLIGNILTQVTIAVAVIAVQVAMTIASFGANSGALAAKIASKFASVSAKVANIAVKAVRALSTTVQIMSALATAGQGSAAIAKGVFTKQALDIKAKITELKGFIKALEDEMDRAREFMKVMMKMMQGTMINMNNLVDLQHQTHEKVIDNRKSYA